MPDEPRILTVRDTILNVEVSAKNPELAVLRLKEHPRPVVMRTELLPLAAQGREAVLTIRLEEGETDTLERISPIIGREPPGRLRLAGKPSEQRRIPLEDLVLGVYSPRLDPGDLTDLQLAMPNLQYPIIVTPFHGKYAVLDGERRVQAARKLGHREIEAKIVYELTPEEAEYLAYDLNAKRKSLNDLEEAYHVYRTMKKYNWSTRQTAAYFGKDHSWVVRKIQLVEKATEELKQAVVSRLTTRTHAEEIVELPPEDQKVVVNKVVADKLPKSTTRLLVDAWKAAGPEQREQLLKAGREELPSLAESILHPTPPSAEDFEKAVGVGATEAEIEELRRAQEERQREEAGLPPPLLWRGLCMEVQHLLDRLEVPYETVCHLDDEILYRIELGDGTAELRLKRR